MDFLHESFRDYCCAEWLVALCEAYADPSISQDQRLDHFGALAHGLAGPSFLYGRTRNAYGFLVDLVEGRLTEQDALIKATAQLDPENRANWFRLDWLPRLYERAGDRQGFFAEVGHPDFQKNKLAAAGRLPSTLTEDLRRALNIAAEADDVPHMLQFGLLTANAAAQEPSTGLSPIQLAATGEYEGAIRKALGHPGHASELLLLIAWAATIEGRGGDAARAWARVRSRDQSIPSLEECEPYREDLFPERLAKDVVVAALAALLKTGVATVSEVTDMLLRIRPSNQRREATACQTLDALARRLSADQPSTAAALARGSVSIAAALASDRQVTADLRAVGFHQLAAAAALWLNLGQPDMSRSLLRTLSGQILRQPNDVEALGWAFEHTWRAAFATAGWEGHGDREDVRLRANNLRDPRMHWHTLNETLDLAGLLYLFGDDDGARNIVEDECVTSLLMGPLEVDVQGRSSAIRRAATTLAKVARLMARVHAATAAADREAGGRLLRAGSLWLSAALGLEVEEDESDWYDDRSDAVTAILRVLSAGALLALSDDRSAAHAGAATASLHASSDPATSDLRECLKQAVNQMVTVSGRDLTFAKGDCSFLLEALEILFHADLELADRWADLLQRLLLVDDNVPLSCEFEDLYRAGVDLRERCPQCWERYAFRGVPVLRIASDEDTAPLPEADSLRATPLENEAQIADDLEPSEEDPGRSEYEGWEWLIGEATAALRNNKEAVALTYAGRALWLPIGAESVPKFLYGRSLLRLTAELGRNSQTAAAQTTAIALCRLVKRLDASGWLEPIVDDPHVPWDLSVCDELVLAATPWEYRDADALQHPRIPESIAVAIAERWARISMLRESSRFLSLVAGGLHGTSHFSQGLIPRLVRLADLCGNGKGWQALRRRALECAWRVRVHALLEAVRFVDQHKTDAHWDEEWESWWRKTGPRVALSVPGMIAHNTPWALLGRYCDTRLNSTLLRELKLIGEEELSVQIERDLLNRIARRLATAKAQSREEATPDLKGSSDECSERMKLVEARMELIESLCHFAAEPAAFGARRSEDFLAEARTLAAQEPHPEDRSEAFAAVAEAEARLCRLDEALLTLSTEVRLDRESFSAIQRTYSAIKVYLAFADDPSPALRLIQQQLEHQLDLASRDAPYRRPDWIPLAAEIAAKARNTQALATILGASWRGPFAERLVDLILSLESPEERGKWLRTLLAKVYTIERRFSDRHSRDASTVAVKARIFGELNDRPGLRDLLVKNANDPFLADRIIAELLKDQDVRTLLRAKDTTLGAMQSQLLSSA